MRAPAGNKAQTHLFQMLLKEAAEQLLTYDIIHVQWLRLKKTTGNVRKCIKL